ncbi:hypothetical protein MY3296_005802 [Beauveria thailandica]
MHKVQHLRLLPADDSTSSSAADSGSTPSQLATSNDPDTTVIASPGLAAAIFDWCAASTTTNTADSISTLLLGSLTQPWPEALFFALR